MRDYSSVFTNTFKPYTHLLCLIIKPKRYHRMNEFEISSIFHEIVLMLAYISGIFVSIRISRKNNVHPSLTFLLILICTLFFLLFSSLFKIHYNLLYLVLVTDLPHIDKTIGILGVVFGLFLSGVLLKIPSNIVHKFSFPFLVIYGISNLGCIAHHNPEMNSVITPLTAGLYSSTELYFSRYLFHDLFKNQMELSVLIRITGGFLAIGIIYYLKDKFTNSFNLCLTTVFFIFLVNFISHFFIASKQILPIYDRLLGMTIFQWAFLLFNVLIMLRVASNETTNHAKQPRLKIKLPSGILVFIIYVAIAIIAVQETSFLSKTKPTIFILGFSLTTIFLVYYFYYKIQRSVLRYSTVVILIVIGTLFLQVRLFDQNEKFPDSATIPKKQINTDQSDFSDKIEPVRISKVKNLPNIKIYHLSDDSLKFSSINSFVENSPLKLPDQYIR